LAFVWVHTTRTQAERDPFLRNVFLGARRRAEQSGFALEQLWTNEPGITDRRLEQIIQSRGIVGVVLSPVMSNEVSLALDWTWQSFAAAVIGNVTWTPELHHASHHHYLGMRRVLDELAKLGCARPAALIEQQSNHRAKRAWEAGFLTHRPVGNDASSLVRVLAPEEASSGSCAEWLDSRAPDALIVSAADLLSAPGLRAACRKRKLPIVTLHWDTGTPPGIGGIDQCYDRIAGHAVDLVITQLNSNETGVPDLPRMMLFSGRWVPPKRLSFKRAAIA
jgi:DNA-binding LacI/PurR family transcriptional regulator